MLDTMREARLIWFRHVNRKCEDVIVRMYERLVVRNELGKVYAGPKRIRGI